MSTAKNTQTGSDCEIVITRLIDAPVERVWRAWADPKEIVKWWGPYGFTTDTNRREFKAGGMWKHTMIGPDGARYPNAARYEEIVEGERLVYTNGGGREGDNKGVHFRAVVTFVAKGNKTELTLGSVFDTPAERDMVVREYGAIEGGRQTLTRLAAHIAGDFLISRLVDAPRERVWKCWIVPERLAAWFGPKGFETVTAKLDFRPRGQLPLLPARQRRRLVGQVDVQGHRRAGKARVHRRLFRQGRGPGAASVRAGMAGADDDHRVVCRLRTQNLDHHPVGAVRGERGRAQDLRRRHGQHASRLERDLRAPRRLSRGEPMSADTVVA